MKKIITLVILLISAMSCFGQKPIHLPVVPYTKIDSFVVPIERHTSTDTITYGISDTALIGFIKRKVVSTSAPLNQNLFGTGTGTASSPGNTWDSTQNQQSWYSKNGSQATLQTFSPFVESSDPLPTLELHPRGWGVFRSYGTSQVGLSVLNPSSVAHESMVINSFAGGVSTGFGISQFKETGTASEVQMQIENTGTGGGTFGIGVTNNTSSLGGGNFFIGDIIGSRADILIDGSGNVGIGTTPQATLDVNGNIKVSTMVSGDANNDSLVMWNPSTGVLEQVNKSALGGITDSSRFWNINGNPQNRDMTLGITTNSTAYSINWVLDNAAFGRFTTDGGVIGDIITLGLSAPITGGNNIYAIGEETVQSNTGSNVVALGQGAVTTGNSGSGVIGIGQQTLNANTGSDVIGIGYEAGHTNTGSNVVALGYEAGKSNSANSIVVLGNNAGQNNTGNELNAIGNGAGLGNLGNLVLGIGSGAVSNNTGQRVIGIGINAASNNTANNVIGIGYHAALNNITSNTFWLNPTLNDVDSTTVLIYGKGDDPRIRINGHLQVNDGTQGANKVLTSDANGLASWQSTALWDTIQCLNGIHTHSITACSPLNINADSIVSTGKVSAPSMRLSNSGGSALTIGGSNVVLASDTAASFAPYLKVSTAAATYATTSTVAGKAKLLSQTIFTPTTGQTITLVNNSYNVINSATPLVALIMTFPASPADGDIIEVKFELAITTVTYIGATIIGGIVAPIAGGYIKFMASGGVWY